MKFSLSFLVLLLLALPSSFILSLNGASSGLALADDAVEGEEAVVEDEDAAEESQRPQDVADGSEDEDEDSEDDTSLKASPDASTKILFTKPDSLDFPAGKPVRFLVGFTNKGEKEFTVSSLEASFRYPQDFSYTFQNFTPVQYDRAVEAQHQATFEYGFVPSENYGARPFGLTILLFYKDSDGNQFQDAVFNDTVNIVELDEGLDGETFFVYVLMAVALLLVVFGVFHVLRSFRKKRRSVQRSSSADGQRKTKDSADLDWIPKELINGTGKSPKTTPRKRRATKRNSGSDE